MNVRELLELTGNGCEICNPERAEELSGYQRIVPNVADMVKEAQGEPMLEAVENTDWEAFDHHQVSAPMRIWLQPDPDDESVTVVGDCTTWCQDPVGANDIEYVLAEHGLDLAEELLEALELLVDTYEDGGWPSAAIVIAKAAIAKAKGE